MKKLIITTCVVLSMVVLPMSNASAGCNWNPQQEQYEGNCGDNTPTASIINNNRNVNKNTNKNVNTNNNTNRNTNTNVQGQVQGQAQGQQQSVNNTNDVNITVNNTPTEQSDTTTRDTGSYDASANVNMRGVRGFATPAEINHVGTPAYSGPIRKDSNVQDVKTMTMYKDTYTRAEVEAALDIVRVDRTTTGEEESSSSWSSKKKDPNQTIKVVISAPARNTVVQTALITVKAKNHDTESKDVLFAALLRGLDTDADLLLITDEGAGTIMKSFGWGIGMSYTRATLSADETTGGVSAGGLGISGGKAGYKSLPWIQAIGLKLK